VSRQKIHLKTDAQVAKMRAAGVVLARTLGLLQEAAKPGVSTLELDRIAMREIKAAGGHPTFYRYRHDPDDPPFPAAICASINEEVVQGIPKKNRRLRPGDVFSVDCGVTLDGWIADSAFTVIVGGPEHGREEDRRLLEVTRGSLQACIEQACHPGKRLFDLAYTIEDYVTSRGFHLVQNFGGHGLGQDLHEAPFIPNEVMPNLQLKLKPGMTLAIEPMVTKASGRVRTKRDNWTVVTAEGKNAAHFEHTIHISEHGPVILTAPEGA
jgi:methionyl aminopeptidase